MNEYDDGGIDWASFELPPEATQAPAHVTDVQTYHTGTIGNRTLDTTRNRSNQNPYPSTHNTHHSNSSSNSNSDNNNNNVSNNSNGKNEKDQFYKLEIERLKAELVAKNEEVFDLHASLGKELYLTRSLGCVQCIF